jgi:DNA-directed RNA polymerase subunit RPC12/RpoP
MGRITWNIEMVKSFVKENSKSKLISSEFFNFKNDLKFICECGKPFTATFNNFMYGDKRTCNMCGFKRSSLKQKIENEVFIEEILNLVGKEYKFLDLYINKKTKLEVLHNKCGKTYFVTPDNFKRGRRCPHCSDARKSNGSKTIIRYLETNSFYFKSEFSLEKCRNVRKLPFDFAIFDRQNNLICLIEYDGEQHFKSSTLFGGEDYLLKTYENDNIKNAFCVNTNIPLIRIPYWRKRDIKHILDHVLGYFKLTNQNVNDSLVHNFLVNHPNWSHDQYIKQVN